MKYIITFRLNNNKTYLERYNALKNYMKNKKDKIVDETTSTFFVESKMSINDLARDIIGKCGFVKEDEILLIQTDSVNLRSGKKSSYIEAIIRIKELRAIEDVKLIDFFEMT